MPVAPAHPNLAVAEAQRLQLDRSTTNVDPHPATSPDQVYRFRQHLGLRDRLLASLASLPVTAKQAARFADCGSQAWIQTSPSTGRVRLVCKTCRLRWCPACRSKHGPTVQRFAVELLSQHPAKSRKLITLTLRHSGRPLRDQLKHLRRSFRRLRQRRAWKSTIAGGIGVIEIKRTDKGEWHPHLHVLCVGTYWDKYDLSRQWAQCSRGSPIVDIRAVADAERAAEYVVKYVTKPADPSFLSTRDLAAEWITAVHGARLIIPFGDKPEYHTERDDDDYPADWEPVSSLARALAARANGEPWAAKLLRELERTPDEPLLFDHLDAAGPPTEMPDLYDSG